MSKHISTREAKREALRDITAYLKELSDENINYAYREQEVINMLEITRHSNIELGVIEHMNKFVLPYTNH